MSGKFEEIMAASKLSELLQIKDERHLSLNQIQSSKYKVVSAIAIFTRSIIDVGVPIAKAYTISDVYIMKTDQCQSSQQLYKVISDAITDFTHLVKRYKHIEYPYWVKICKGYISHHLHQHIMHEYQPLFLSSCFTLFFFAFLGLYLFIAISTESLTIHSTAGIRYLIASSTAVLSS